MKFVAFLAIVAFSVNLVSSITFEEISSDVTNFAGQVNIEIDALKLSVTSEISSRTVEIVSLLKEFNAVIGLVRKYKKRGQQLAGEYSQLYSEVLKEVASKISASIVESDINWVSDVAKNEVEIVRNQVLSFLAYDKFQADFSCWVAFKPLVTAEILEMKESITSLVYSELNTLWNSWDVTKAKITEKYDLYRSQILSCNDWQCVNQEASVIDFFWVFKLTFHYFIVRFNKS